MSKTATITILVIAVIVVGIIVIAAVRPSGSLTPSSVMPSPTSGDQSQNTQPSGGQTPPTSQTPDTTPPTSPPSTNPPASTPPPATNPPPTTPPPATPQTVSISIQNFAFNPGSITIKAGTKVTWTNQDSAPHQVASDPHPTHTDLPGLNSGILAQGTSFSFTFSQAGTFGYHCHLHPSMKGTIIVTQ